MGCPLPPASFISTNISKSEITSSTLKDQITFFNIGDTWRYIFIHGWFSSVIRSFSGVGIPWVPYELALAIATFEGQRAEGDALQI